MGTNVLYDGSYITALGMTIYKLSGAFATTGLSLGNTLQLIFAVLL